MAMRFAAGLTLTGLLGFLILEALKIILAPLSIWLLGVVVFLAKLMLGLVAAGLILVAIGLGVFLYRRYQRTEED